MSEMVERVAKAMWQRDTERKKGFAATLGAHYVALTHNWDQCDLIWKDLARAAIGAMHEPTPQILACLGMIKDDKQITMADVKTAWGYAIEDTLKEGA